MAIHKLKCWPEHYIFESTGDKPYTIRWDDRGFKEGDTIITREWDNELLEYTGREFIATITHVYSGMGLERGYAILSLKKERE